MRIEEELQQKRFFDVYQKAHINVMYSANWLIEQTKQVLVTFNITHQQYNVLRILKGRYPESCSACDIKEVMIDKGPDLTRLIDRLIIKKYVTRTVCEENRRKLDITITDQGMILIKKIGPRMKRKFIENTTITKNEAIELNNILDKMRS